MSGQTWSVVQGDVVGPAIRLQVNSSAPEFTGRNDETVRLISDSSGIRIIGKTPMAARHGAYILLERLGVRWFFKHPAWEVVPKSLSDPGGFDEVQEPFYFWRAVISVPYVGAVDTQKWNVRNRLYGTKSYSVYHSYANIIARSEYGAHPEWFLPEGRPLGGSATYPWQLKTDNPEVIARAIQYARTFLGKPPSKFNASWNDIVPSGSAPISPNDGLGWDPPYGTDWQLITDKVFGLANEVAKAVKNDFPDKYVSLYSYSSYSGVPSIALEPNLLVEIATAYNRTPLTLVERIRGIKAKGVVVGIRDYVDIWVWYQDPPKQNFDRIAQLAWYADQGIRVYHGEAGDGWGGRGLTYYLMSKLFWHPSENIDALLDDFYSKAFGPAKQVMKHYFEIRNADTPSLAASFRDLKQAESLGAGDEEILERIRHLEYYNRYLWLWKNKGIKQLNVDELKKFYTFTSKTRDLYVVYYRYVEEGLRKELTSRGLTDAEIKSLQNFTPPTPSEAKVMLDEALAALTVPPPVQSLEVNPRRIALRPLGDNSRPGLDPLHGNDRTILIPSGGNEDIKIMVKGQQGTLQWYEPTGLLLDSWSFNSANNFINWTPVTFRAELPGTYVLHATALRPSASYKMSVDVPNRPASILADPALKVFAPETDLIKVNDPAYMGPNAVYFYVPQGAGTFSFGADVSDPTRHAHGELIDPNGVIYPFDFGATTEKTFDSPVPGVWKVTMDMLDRAGRFWFRGILPLVWHDPRYLLVPSDAFTNMRRLEDPHSYSPQNRPPVAQDQNVTVNGNSSNAITLLASDPDGNSLTYGVAAGPSHGKLSGTPPALTYTPNPDFSGVDSFKFTASDGTAISNSATISITVNPLLIAYLSPGGIGLRSLGDNTMPTLEPMLGNYRSILVPSKGNEDVKVMVKGYAGVLQWYGPTRLLIDSWGFSSADNLTNWTSVTFRAGLPGTYVLHITRASPSASRYISVDVPNRPASILADHGKQLFTPQVDSLSMNAPAYMGPNAVYFYVPQGTGTFSFGADVSDPTRHAHGELIDPGGVKHPFDFGTTTEIPFASPAPGAWKISIDMPITFGRFWFKGITPLVWHDPRYLLVP